MRFEQKGEAPPIPEKKKKIVVEIGPGGLPAFVLGEDFVDGRGELSDDETYIAVERNRDSVENIGSIYKDQKGFHPILGDAKRLMFKDGSVDEMIFTNVFGDPNTRSMEQLLKEAVRVLKPDGKIFITETYTPELVQFERNKMQRDFSTQFEKYGLVIEKHITKQGDREKFNNTSSEDSFQLILKKKK